MRRGGEKRQSVSTCRLVPDGGGADPVTYGGVEHVPFQGQGRSTTLSGILDCGRSYLSVGFGPCAFLR